MKKICSIEDCNKELTARGWCSLHYNRWRKHGDPLRVDVQLPPEDGLCMIPDCNRNYYCAGVCSGHYVRRVRNGDNASEAPLEDRFYDPEESFLAQILDTGDCIEWTGWLSPDGYGKFKTGGKSTFAHRYAWVRANGPIPEGMEVDHACHNTACVKIAHLRLATRSENVRNLTGATANNKHSGARNVGKMGDRWRVRITKDGKVHALGCFDTIDEARAVAAEGRARLFGEFAGKG